MKRKIELDDVSGVGMPFFYIISSCKRRNVQK